MEIARAGRDAHLLGVGDAIEPLGQFRGRDLRVFEFAFVAAALNPGLKPVWPLKISNLIGRFRNPDVKQVIAVLIATRAAENALRAEREAFRQIVAVDLHERERRVRLNRLNLELVELTACDRRQERVDGDAIHGPETLIRHHCDGGALCWFRDHIRIRLSGDDIREDRGAAKGRQTGKEQRGCRWRGPFLHMEPVIQQANALVRRFHFDREISRMREPRRPAQHPVGRERQTRRQKPLRQCERVTRRGFGVLRRLLQRACLADLRRRESDRIWLALNGVGQFKTLNLQPGPCRITFKYCEQNEDLRQKDLLGETRSFCPDKAHARHRVRFSSAFDLSIPSNVRSVFYWRERRLD